MVNAESHCQQPGSKCCCWWSRHVDLRKKTGMNDNLLISVCRAAALLSVQQGANEEGSSMAVLFRLSLPTTNVLSEFM